MNSKEEKREIQFASMLLEDTRYDKNISGNLNYEGLHTMHASSKRIQGVRTLAFFDRVPILCPQILKPV